MIENTAKDKTYTIEFHIRTEDKKYVRFYF